MCNSPSHRVVGYNVCAHRFFSALVSWVGVCIQLELVEKLQWLLLHIVVEVQLRARQSAQCLPSKNEP